MAAIPRSNSDPLIPPAGSSVCAVIDFVWGYVHEHSISAGVISVVGGLFSSTWYLLLFWDRDNISDGSRRS
jgi:hypothetical protein